MKNLFIIFGSAMLVLGLSGCLASTTSPVGVNCDYTPGESFWELPLACQGR